MPRITFPCDDLDATAIHYAVSLHQQSARVDGVHSLPEHDGDTIGAVLAEICRGWCERQGKWPPPSLAAPE